MPQPQRRRPPTAPPPTQPPSIRLFRPTDAPTDTSPPAPPRPSPRWTLTQFFCDWAWPQRIGLTGRPRTYREYRITLSLWRLGTGDPPLGRIRDEHLTAFWESLRRRPGRHGSPALSPNTVRKHGRHLRFLFRLAGPRVRCEDSATVEGLFGRYRRRIAGRLVIGEHRLPPRIKLPKPRHKAPEDYFEIDEIERWIAAAQSAAVPQIPGVPPALWWQALIIYAYNTGLRIGTLLAVKFAWHRRDREGRLWVEIPPGIDKGGDAERVYVNRAAEEVMEMIRTERANVFPWPHCRRHLDTIRLELLARAGIPEHRRWGFHGLRKSSAGQIAETRMDVAQMQLGHAGIEMTRRHYVSQNVVAATMEQMPQPRNRRTAAIDPRQRMLFEKGSG